MTKMLKYLMIAAAATLSACTDSPSAPTDSVDSLTLVLNISESATESRAAAPASDIDGISCLRVIIARPDGTVEINRLVYPDGNAIRYDDLTFDIRRDDYKMVFLIANEYATGSAFGNVTYISPDALYNPSAITDTFIDTYVSSLPTAQHEPMTAVYRLSTELKYAQWQAPNYVISYNLKLMRAVTKFTFNVYNYRNIPIEMTEIGIDGISAQRYHLMPRVMTPSGDEIVHFFTMDGPDSVTESGSGGAPVPGNSQIADSPFSEYYRTYFSAADIGAGLHLFCDSQTVVLPSSEPLVLEYYYYESNLPDNAAPDKPYTLYVGFDNNLYSTPLDNLPALPRNTHVVVNLTFTNNDKVLDIEVLPYYGVDLYPTFGQ